MTYVAKPKLHHPTLPKNKLGFTRRDYEGKVVLVNFWASWCPPCTSELPLLEKTQKEMAKAGGTVLGINTRDASEDALGFVNRYDLTFPSLRDGEGSYAENWGLTGYPESFLLDEEGRVTAAGVERARYDVEQGRHQPLPPGAVPPAPMRFRPRRPTT